MWKCTPLIFLFALIFSCSGENAPRENIDSAEDTTASVSIPTFDITGDFDVLFIRQENAFSFENGMKVLTVNDLSEKDTLAFRYNSLHSCEECHVEFQIWKNNKYVDLVRDTGFGGEIMYIPASLFLRSSKFGTPEYERLSIYLSVRQYHPVETGNKRFLFYLDMK
jgi:hypothetical protein